MASSMRTGFLQAGEDPRETGNYGKVPSRISFNSDGYDSANRDGSDQEDQVGHDGNGAYNKDADNLKQKIAKLEEQEAEHTQDLDEFDTRWHARRQPLQDKLDKTMKELDQARDELEVAMEPKIKPPGPDILTWVDSTEFGTICAVVVSLNLMIVAASFKYTLPDWTPALDHVFLTWYCFEITVKMIYYQKQLFFGTCGDSMLNWLDLSIVIGGVVLQWLYPLFMGTGGGASSTMLGALRIFRLLRLFKLLKLMLQGDLSWTESERFQFFMTGVIGANAILMSLELDRPWSGWADVEVVLLIIYCFELIVSMKYQGKKFFYPPTVWNYMDMIIVFGAVVDIGLMPMLSFILTTCGQPDSTNSPELHDIMKLLRLMRLLRILRLVKLMKAIPPLYRLLHGVLEAFQAMQWVMVLCIVVLYGMAIFWTTVVGEGLIFGGESTPAVKAAFGTVCRSLFSLFRMMNGDTDFAEEVFTIGWGQIIYAIFMIIASWAILAILTSVVSDNMIAASSRTEQENEVARQLQEDATKAKRLRVIFSDEGSDGIISEAEWNAFMLDSEKEERRQDLCEATGLGLVELHQTFKDLRVPLRNEGHMGGSRTAASAGKAKRSQTETTEYLELVMYYESFIEFMLDAGKPVDKQMFLRLQAKIDQMEAKLDQAQQAGNMLGASPQTSQPNQAVQPWHQEYRQEQQHQQQPPHMPYQA